MQDSPYFKQAKLMLRVLPHVASEEGFALKGGSAINFFLRDMPRLSVDIDLVWLPLSPRDTALADIGRALGRIAGRIRKAMPDATVQEDTKETVRGCRKAGSHSVWVGLSGAG